MAPDRNNQMYVDANFYNRNGRRMAMKAERTQRNRRGPNFTKPKKRR